MNTGIEVKNGKYRIRLSRKLYNGYQRYISTGLEPNKANLLVVKKVTQEIEKDIASNSFDTTLERYQYWKHKRRKTTLSISPDVKWDRSNEYLRLSKGLREKDITDQLQALIGGIREVETPHGFIDLLTLEELVEVKIAREWKHALGQVLVYGLEYPEHGKRIHLYGHCTDPDIVTSACEALGVSVSWAS